MCPHALSQIIITLMYLQLAHLDSSVLSESIKRPMGAAASNAGAYTYIHLHMYVVLCYTNTMHVCYVCISVKSIIFL
jgi:hypothetical protein